jgi:prolipoprotein diacylglyceryltransferase
VTGAVTVIASIPSPSSNGLSLGPLTVHFYGLMIALGVLAAIWLCGRRGATTPTS